MSSVARANVRRLMSGFATEVAGRNAQDFAESAERETETLRQMSDVLGDVGRLSVDVGAVWHVLGEVRAEVAETRKIVADLVTALETQIELTHQSTELLGRLVESARARLDALEEATQTTA